MKKLTSAVLAAATLLAATPAFAGDDYRYYEQNRANFITHDAAAQKAVAAVGGGQAEDVEFDRDSRYGDVFEVDVRTTNGKYDVKIDAKTGAVVKKKLDN
ncbi:MAG: PepSY domain-containing protein [Neisseria sp.]|nr:PepSY domain-containing protein [Neisseria sp.]